MRTVNFFKYAVFALALGFFATACDDDDPVKDPTEQGDGCILCGSIYSYSF